MNVLAWMVVGIVLGWLSGVLSRGSGYGTTGDILVGVAGSLCGGFLVAGLFSLPDPLMEINLATILAAFICSIASLVIVQRLGSKTRTLS